MKSRNKKIKFKVVRLPIKFPFGFSGITLPYLVLLSKDADKTVLIHEIVHCMQISTHGVFRFYKYYLEGFYKAYRYHGSFLKAYYDVWFEIVAYKLQNNKNFLSYYDEKTKTITVGYKDE